MGEVLITGLAISVCSAVCIYVAADCVDFEDFVYEIEDFVGKIKSFF